MYNTIPMNNENDFNMAYCKNSEYITTKTQTVGSNKIMYQINKNGDNFKVDTIVKPFTYVGEFDLTVAKLLRESKSQFGEDVTISNIRWDYVTFYIFSFKFNAKRYAATYDIIRCK
jgi:hypothetical protein